MQLGRQMLNTEVKIPNFTLYPISWLQVSSLKQIRIFCLSSTNHSSHAAGPASVGTDVN